MRTAGRTHQEKPRTLCEPRQRGVRRGLPTGKYGNLQSQLSPSLMLDSNHYCRQWDIEKMAVPFRKQHESAFQVQMNPEACGRTSVNVHCYEINVFIDEYTTSLK